VKAHYLAPILAIALQAHAGQVTIQNAPLGSGTPGAIRNEPATPVDVGNGVYHAPQYMPFYPTAASIWPRVIEVPCTKVGEDLDCSGYHWLPEYGRAEYLFFIPRVTEPVPPVVIEAPPKIIYVEVPPKKKRE
jgi:hypothetical protein